MAVVGREHHLPDNLFPHAETVADPQRHAATILDCARSSFAFGLKTLPKARREAMTAVYAFARTIDDIADGDAPLEEKHEALAAWHREIDALYEGAPRSAIGQALLPAVTQFALPKREFTLMVEGMEMDADGPILAPPMERLAAYTRRVAGTVGQLSVRCFGAPPSPERDTFALALADALQLTNILRDVEEDAERGRVYLPAELLKRHGIASDPAMLPTNPSLLAVCQNLGAIARERFAAARAALAKLDRRPLRPALIFMGVYEGYLDRMEQAGWARAAALRKMGKAEKVARGLRYAFWLPSMRFSLPSAPPLCFPERNETVDAI